MKGEKSLLIREWRWKGKRRRREWPCTTSGNPLKHDLSSCSQYQVILRTVMTGVCERLAQSHYVKYNSRKSSQSSSWLQVWRPNKYINYAIHNSFVIYKITNITTRLRMQKWRWWCYSVLMLMLRLELWRWRRRLVDCEWLIRRHGITRSKDLVRHQH